MTELEKKLTNALLMIRSHINEPKVITSILDKNIGTDEDVIPVPGDDTSPEAFDKADDKGKANIINKVLTEPDDNDLAGTQQAINDALVKEPEDDNHFGEEQAEGLDNLLEGLRDTPHDNRW